MTVRFEHQDKDTGFFVSATQEDDVDMDQMCDLLFQFCCAIGYFPSSVAKAMREKADEIECDLRLQAKGLEFDDAM
jgi:hypothetical protein